MKTHRLLLAPLIRRHGFRVLWSVALALLLLIANSFTPSGMAAIAAGGSDQAARQVTSDLAELQHRIGQVNVLRGDFQQEKHVEGFRNPLRSGGRFVNASEYGVLWQTLKPFPSDVVLTRDRILTRQADGRSRVELDARQQPALRTVNTLMFALMSGDVDALEEYFDLRITLLPDNHWRLVLLPKSDAVARAFEQVTLEGGRHVQHVLIEEPGGDRTQLTFTGLTEEPSQLDADETNRFD